MIPRAYLGRMHAPTDFSPTIAAVDLLRVWKPGHLGMATIALEGWPEEGRVAS